MLKSSERGNRKLKILDRAIGIPLVATLGVLAKLLRGRREPPPSPGRIGVLMTAAIGDTILVSAVIEDLKTRWPACEVVMFVGASNRAMIQLLRGVKCIEISATHPVRALVTLMRSGRFDIFIDTGQWARLNSLLTLFSRATVRVGFKTLGQRREAAYDLHVDHRSDLHELENFRNLARAIGVHPSHVPDFSVAGLIASTTPYAVFHMFAGGQNPYQKEWPKESWIALAARLPKDWEIVLTGGKENISDADAFLASPRDRIFRNEVGRRSLANTAELLQNAELVVSVNTGILHLAASTGTLTVALNGPTNAKRWGPIGEYAFNVSSPRFCAPCLNLGFDYACPLDACMREITVDHAWKVIAEASAKRETNSIP